MEAVALQCPGFSGADLANLINEASLLAVRADKPLVEQVELEEAIDRVLSGPERKSHVLSREELWRIAIHESGHALVARAIDNPVSLQKLSIVTRGRGRGGATLYSSADKSLLTHLDLIRNLVTAMAGAAAEEYVFGMLSTGVEGDLEAASKIAHSMVAVYGMSAAIGPVAIGEKPGEIFLGRDLAQMNNVAAATLELVDSETRRFVREAESTAGKVLKMNAALLGDLANTLLVRETLSGPALAVFLENVIPWPDPLLSVLDGESTPIAMRAGRAATADDETLVGDWPGGGARGHRSQPDA
jgi:cell division protease FtsH